MPNSTQDNINYWTQSGSGILGGNQAGAGGPQGVSTPNSVS